MKPSALCAVFLLVEIACAQDVPPPIDGLIKQLGSADYRKRDAAMKALLGRPDAEGPLRVAMQSKDLELPTRAARIINDFEARPFRELDDAIATGRVERATDLIAKWPLGDKTCRAVWRRISDLSLMFIDQMGPSFEPERKRWDQPLGNMGIGGRITSYDFDPLTRLTMHDFLLRADEIELGLDPVSARDKKWDPGSWSRIVAFSAGRIGIRREILSQITAFAVNDVQIDGNMGCCLVVSGGNVAIDGSMSNCLIVAKGAVTWRKPLGGSVRIISGKTVIYDKTKSLPQNVVIVENESNPLGFVQWGKADHRPNGKADHQKGEAKTVDGKK
jgi:hypothetical protein